MADVYYSVGTSTSDFKTGTPTMTIASGVMTFSAAQTGNIGVGDIVLANAISYMIVGKTSTSVWSVRNINGTAASNVGSPTSVTSIKRAFNLMQDAMHGSTPMVGDASHLNTLGLVAADFNLFVACYADGVDDSLTNITSNFTTDATHRITIYTPIDTAAQCNQSQRHNGVQNGGGYTNKSTSSTSFRYNFFLDDNNFLTVRGIKIIRTSTNWGYGQAIRNQLSGTSKGQDNIIDSNLIIAETGANANEALLTSYTSNTNGLRCQVKNNIVISESSVCFGGLNSQTSFADLTSEQCQIYNNTVYGSFASFAIRLDATSSADAGRQNCKNNYAYNNTANPDYVFVNQYTNSVVNFAYNASDDTTAGTANSNQRILVANAKFTDETAGQVNVHLLVGSSLIAAGIGPSADANVPTTDIDGNARSGATTDIGGDLFIAPPSMAILEQLGNRERFRR